MLRALDILLRDLLVANLPGITSVQVRFEPPDATWRSSILAQLPEGVVDFSLVDVREHRKLRSNERIRTIDRGIAIDEPAPARVDFHYLVTTWSKATPKVNLQPALDEHQLLYDVAAVLIRNAPFNPSRLYLGGSANWPPPFDDIDLPVAIAPPEGFGKLSEFWSTLGTTSRWKPAIWLVVTLPIQFVEEITGPIVTTRIATWQIDGHTESRDVVMQIGGFVLDSRPPVGGGPVPDPLPPIEGAWVRLESIDGTALQAMRTDEQGRFTFAKLRSDRYRLSTFAPGSSVAKVTTIDVPSATGSYEVLFT